MPALDFVALRMYVQIKKRKRMPMAFQSDAAAAAAKQ